MLDIIKFLMSVILIIGWLAFLSIHSFTFLFHNLCRLSFGWYRAEVIGALVSVLLIWVITGILVVLAVQRVVTNEYEVDATIMLITSLIGLGANLM